MLLLYIIIIIIVIVIIIEKQHQAAVKGTKSLGGQKKRKDSKTRKRSEEKEPSFNSAFLFPARKRKAVTLSVTTGIDHPTEENPGNQYRQRLGGQTRPRVHPKLT